MEQYAPWRPPQQLIFEHSQPTDRHLYPTTWTIEWLDGDWRQRMNWIVLSWPPSHFLRVYLVLHFKSPCLSCSFCGPFNRRRTASSFQRWISCIRWFFLRWWGSYYHVVVSIFISSNRFLKFRTHKPTHGDGSYCASVLSVPSRHQHQPAKYLHFP